MSKKSDVSFFERQVSSTQTNSNFRKPHGIGSVSKGKEHTKATPQDILKEYQLKNPKNLGM